MKSRLNQISTSKISEVISEVKEIREELSQEYIDNCIESMPSRLQECINNEGDWINYLFFLIISNKNRQSILSKFCENFCHTLYLKL